MLSKGYCDEITRQLIDGSRNIDRMKMEVEQVVRMVIGYKLNGVASFPLVFSKDFTSSKVVWHLEADLTSFDLRRKFINVSCKMIKDRETTNYLFHVSSSTRDVHFPSHDAQLVYDELHVFVGGMLEAYPELAGYWEPLVKASFKF